MFFTWKFNVFRLASHIAKFPSAIHCVNSVVLGYSIFKLGAFFIKHFHKTFVWDFDRLLFIYRHIDCVVYTKLLLLFFWFVYEAGKSSMSSFRENGPLQYTNIYIYIYIRLYKVLKITLWNICGKRIRWMISHGMR